MGIPEETGTLSLRQSGVYVTIFQRRVSVMGHAKSGIGTNNDIHSHTRRMCLFRSDFNRDWSIQSSGAWIIKYIPPGDEYAMGAPDATRT